MHQIRHGFGAALFAAPALGATMGWVLAG